MYVQECICEGVYTGFMLICMCGYVCVCVLDAQSRPAFCDPVNFSSPGSSVHGILPGKNIGLDCHSPLQLPFSGIEPGLLYYRQILYQLSHRRSPIHIASQVALVIKTLPASAGDVRDVGLIPGSGRSPEGHSNQVQYSYM